MPPFPVLAWTCAALPFDATNFFTFLDSFNLRAKLSQRGHGKQGHDHLRLQLHHTYAGNQHDSVTFRSVAEQLFARCRSFSQVADQTTLVFDKGNNWEENLPLVDQSLLHCIHRSSPQNPTQSPRLRILFRQAQYQKPSSTLLGKTILFTDHAEDWSDEQIVLAYRAQHHVEADFRR